MIAEFTSGRGLNISFLDYNEDSIVDYSNYDSIS